MAYYSKYNMPYAMPPAMTPPSRPERPTFDMPMPTMGTPVVDESKKRKEWADALLYGGMGLMSKGDWSGLAKAGEGIMAAREFNRDLEKEAKLDAERAYTRDMDTFRTKYGMHRDSVADTRQDYRDDRSDFTVDRNFGFQVGEANRSQANSDRDFGFRVSEAGRDQSNRDRDFGFRESEAERDQRNRDRGFDYQAGRDNVLDARDARNFDYQRGRDAVRDDQWGKDYNIRWDQNAREDDLHPFRKEGLFINNLKNRYDNVGPGQSVFDITQYGTGAGPVAKTDFAPTTRNARIGPDGKPVPMDITPQEANALDDHIGRLAPPDFAIPTDLRNRINQRAGELYGETRNAATAAQQAWKELTDGTVGGGNPFVTNEVKAREPSSAPASAPSSAPASAPSSQTPAGNGGQSGVSSSAGGAMPQPKSKADYDALPNGTKYLAPDGSIRTKGGA